MKITFFKKEKKFKKGGLSLSLNLYWKFAVYFVFVVTLDHFHIVANTQPLRGELG